jgi:hypothetical protein
MFVSLDKYVPFETVSDSDLLKARLFHKCRLSESGCWLWVGTKDTGGYGMISRACKYTKAHRVSYEAFVGPIPSGLHVLHACDNPACINPAHLSVGTVKENMAERDARGRRNVKGEQIGTSKITADDALYIKQSNESLGVLAKKFGVSDQQVWRIKRGESWKHLNAVAKATARGQEE